MTRFFGVLSTVLIASGIVLSYAAVCYADDYNDSSGSVTINCNCLANCTYDIQKAGCDTDDPTLPDCSKTNQKYPNCTPTWCSCHSPTASMTCPCQ
jgi:hypothetical protein